MFLFNWRQKFIKPFDTGYLPEKDGHRVFYQQVGNPEGEVVLMFHGGPGGCSRASKAALFNLKKYRVLMFDQRGCGKSLFDDAFHCNTTPDTIEDAARLLDYLRIEAQITVAGGSFGSTCALLFAQTYPARTKRLILNSIFLARPKDAENMSPIAPYFYPDILDILQKQPDVKNTSNRQKTASDMFNYYYDLAFSKKQEDRQTAVKYFQSFERMIGSLDVSFPSQEATEDQIRSFQIFMHYQKNNFFLRPDQILQDISKISEINTLIYHNRLDFCCPPYQAFELHQAMPNSALFFVPDQGHCTPKLYARMYRDKL